MPVAIFKVENTALAKEGDALQRVATRIPVELRQWMKLACATLGTGLNELYALVLREFLVMAADRKVQIAWKKAGTSPRVDRHGEPRGDSKWVQILLILPTSLIRDIEDVCAVHQQSLASVCYTAFDWYAEKHANQSQPISSLRQQMAQGFR